jgi:hypothetical protein
MHQKPLTNPAASVTIECSEAQDIVAAEKVYQDVVDAND